MADSFTPRKGAGMENRRSSLSFPQRMLVGFGLIFVVSVTAYAASYQVVRSLIDTNRWVEHTQEVRAELTGLQSVMEDVETGQRGYLLTGQPRYMEPYDAALQQVDVRLRNLTRLTVDNREQQRQLPLLQAAIQHKLEEVGLTLRLYHQHRYTEVQKTILSDQGKTQMDIIRGIVRQMRTTENGLLERRTAAASDSARKTLFCLTIFVLLILGVLCFTFYLMHRYFRERREAEEERTRLLHRLVTMQEDERRRISRELHDEMGQSLVALMLGLDTVAADIPAASPVRGQLQRLQQFSKQVSRDIHRIAWELRPTALDDLGLESALRHYLEEWAERTEIEADFHCVGAAAKQYAQEIESALYRVVQEALNNIAKHAQASRVSLILERRADYTGVIIEDDGIGMESDTRPRSSASGTRLGLVGMRERIALVGGHFTIESAPDQGTTLFVRIPLNSGQERAAHA